MTFINYAATTSFFIYSILLLLQTRELWRNKTLGSLSLIEVTIRLYSGYVIFKKCLQLDDKFLIVGQIFFTSAIVLLWAVALVMAIREHKGKLMTFKSLISAGILITAGIIMITVPIDIALICIFVFLIYGLIIQSVKVLQRKNVISIVISEVTVRLIGSYFVTAKVVMTGDYWYSHMQVVFAVFLNAYWITLIITGTRSGEIKERWRSAMCFVKRYVK